MMDKHIFLIGSGPPVLPNMAIKYSKLAKPFQTHISILFIERPGWEEYLNFVTRPLRENGLMDYHFLPLPRTSIHEVIQSLLHSSGIIILGGDTNRYADFIVDTEIGDIIKKKYHEGVPIAGFSAGALISLDPCIISAKDNDQNAFQVRKGIGLIDHMAIAVHFTQWEDEGHLREIAEKFPSMKNLGIDEKTCVYLKNGEITEIEGHGVYTVEKGKVNQIN